ncbi:Hydrophobic seed protein [Actinidia chinensis var. chinensis]|uniref:Hydrophobic seed protein n=1 Tax=Actinidia chinensis var. chinensis TaxID=1590841 RepID=A0A2R6QRX9_ACTCC|nr:Hydrophobic seed protein [Actinidia chinensis var. chinensis]
MESSKFNALLFISMLFISSATPILGCGSCGKPPSKHKPKGPKGPVVKPPVTLPPIVKPPITLPPIVKPPITLPPVIVPPIKPPVTVPPVTVPPILPPVTVPPVTVPPVLTPPTGTPCPPPPGAAATCPIDTLKLGACVDLLGGLVHIGLGDPAANECCPVLAGLVELEAAVCLCTTLKIKALNLNIFVPIALQLLITCGKTPPPGYTCSV